MIRRRRGRPGIALAALIASLGCSGGVRGTSRVGGCESLLVFDSDRNGASDVFLLDLDARAVRNLTPGDGPGDENRFPDLSPGGAEVVFVSEDTLGLGDLYVVGTDGSGLRRLTREPAFYENPAWSIDGEWIAFERGTDEGWGLFVIRPDGGGLHRVGPPGADLFHPSWAPDGRRIAVVTGTDNRWVAGILSLDSGTVQPVTEPGLGVGSVQWSPDGATIALDAVVESNFDLYLLDLESGRLRRLTRGRGVDARPTWSPHGSRLAFHSTRDRGASVGGQERWDEFELYVLDLSTGETDRLTDNGFLDAHPDCCWPALGGARRPRG